MHETTGYILEPKSDGNFIIYSGGNYISVS